MKRTILITLILGLFCSFSEAQTAVKDVIHACGLFGSGRYEESVAVFDRVIDNYPKYIPKCTYYRGISLYRLQRFTDAKYDLQFASKSGFAEANLWLARIEVHFGQFNDAAYYIEKYLRNAKHPEISQIKKDSVFRKLHDTDAWFSLWQKDLITDESKIHEEVNFYMNKKDFEQAHEKIESNLGKEYDDAYLYMLNSEVYFQEEINQLALNEINRAISLQPENAELLERKVRYLVQLKLNDKAVEIITKLLENDPGDFSLRFMRANAAFGAGNYELAEDDNTIYLKYFDEPDAKFLMGRILYEETRYLEALKYFNKLLESDTSQAKYFFARGMTYYQTKTYKFAAYDLSMSLDLEPDNAQANLYLGIAKYHLGDNKLCCYYLKRAKNFGELSAISYLQKYCDKTERP